MKGQTPLADSSDEELVRAARDGSAPAADCLLERYKNFVKSKARMYYLVGADQEDIIQEGMIGLYNAIQNYREERHNSFRAFADMCVTRKMISAIKAANRQKNIPLNTYVSLYRPIYEEEGERTLLDVLPGDVSVNPEERLINREHLVRMADAYDERLTPLERDVLREYLSGFTYEDIARRLRSHTKAVDNALQRIKKKTEQMLREQAELSMTPEERENAKREGRWKEIRVETERLRFVKENLLRFQKLGLRKERARFLVENQMKKTTGMGVPSPKMPGCEV